MPLYTMAEILKDAQENSYGVGFYNAVNLEMIRAYIRAAEDEKSPVIIGTAEVLLNYSDFDWITPALLSAARQAAVPVAVHLDHAYSFDTIMRALRAGFGSVMFDGSSLDYEENIRISKEIAKIAHPMGAGLECELGKVGGLDEGEGVKGENVYTDPEHAKDFVTRTGADFLAISIGTTHGVYAETPKLDFSRLSEIRRDVCIPLVLHGGSGLSDLDFKTCIKRGICKVNVYTDVITGAINRIRERGEELGYTDLLQAAENAMYDITVEKIRTFGSGGRA
ncbi:MAG: class II fructose-bisphosphate aldolase [Oscillospiraceae bacterium]|nr:class II fructose-bisphosphate aldolase [Oscillospiraceae bacterium]